MENQKVTNIITKFPKSSQQNNSEKSYKLE